MLVIMRKDANLEQINFVITGVQGRGYRAHLLRGADQTIVGVVGEGNPGSGAPKLEEWFGGAPGVQEIVPISKAYKLTSREFIPRDTVFSVDGATFGGPGIVIMAGPCSVESRSQLLETAQAVKEAGRAYVARGRLQTAHLPLFVSRDGRGRA